MATLASLGLTGAGMWRSATRSDAISVERQQRIMKRSVATTVGLVSHTQESLALWDEAVQKSRPPYDAQWFKANVSTYSQEQFGSGQTFILDARDHAIYGSIEGRVVDPSRFQEIRPAVERMIDEVRGRAPAHGSAEDQLETDPAKAPPGLRDARGLPLVFAAHLEPIAGRAAAVGVMRIAPSSRLASLVPGQEPLLVTLRLLDQRFLDTLDNDHLVTGARVGASSAHTSYETSIALRSPEGEIVGYLIWRPRLIGAQLIDELIPLAVISGTITIGIMALLALRLRSAMRKLADGEARAWHDSMHDSLTALPNRALFADRVDISCAHAERGQSSALLLLDLDRFKTVNDTLGHAAGDGVLLEFARRVRSLLRASDTVARFGGDEFGIILPNIDSREAVETLCRMILAAAARPFGLAEGVARVGVSIGVALLPEAGVGRLEVMRAADRALYWAKAEGRGHFRLFDADPTQMPAFALAVLA